MLKELFQFQGPGKEFDQESQHFMNYPIKVDGALPLLPQLLAITTCDNYLP